LNQQNDIDGLSRAFENHSPMRNMITEDKLELLEDDDPLILIDDETKGSLRGSPARLPNFQESPVFHHKH
jgi:hypothetical protein